jgi:uncharacterized integral membrane protein
MHKFILAVVWIPLGLIFLVFAVANRHSVTISLDPFNADPAGGVSMPLFAVIIGVAMLGVLAGGITTWIRQRRWRKSSRRYQAEALEAKTQLAQLRASLATATAPVEQRPRLLERSSQYTGERDKSAATL